MKQVILQRNPSSWQSGKRKRTSGAAAPRARKRAVRDVLPPVVASGSGQADALATLSIEEGGVPPINQVPTLVINNSCRVGA